MSIYWWIHGNPLFLTILPSDSLFKSSEISDFIPLPHPPDQPAVFSACSLPKFGQQLPRIIEPLNSQSQRIPPALPVSFTNFLHYVHISVTDWSNSLHDFFLYLVLQRANAIKLFFIILGRLEGLSAGLLLFYFLSVILYKIFFHIFQFLCRLISSSVLL